MVNNLETNGTLSLSKEFLTTRNSIGLAMMYLRHKELIPRHISNNAWQVKWFEKEWANNDPAKVWYKIYFINTYRDKKGQRVKFNYALQVSAEELNTFQKGYKRRKRKKKPKL